MWTPTTRGVFHLGRRLEWSWRGTAARHMAPLTSMSPGPGRSTTVPLRVLKTNPTAVPIDRPPDRQTNILILAITRTAFTGPPRTIDLRTNATWGSDKPNQVYHQMPPCLQGTATLIQSTDYGAEAHELGAGKSPLNAHEGWLVPNMLIADRMEHTTVARGPVLPPVMPLSLTTNNCTFTHTERTITDPDRHSRGGKGELGGLANTIHERANRRPNATHHSRQRPSATASDAALTHHFTHTERTITDPDRHSRGGKGELGGLANTIHERANRRPNATHHSRQKPSATASRVSRLTLERC